MNSLTQLRQDVAETLTSAGLNAFAFVPQRVSAPLVAVTADAPYVITGPTFTGYTVGLTVRVVNRPGTEDVEDEQMEDAICDVLAALAPFEFAVSVGQPFYLTIGTANYPTTDISVATNITKIERGA